MARYIKAIWNASDDPDFMESMETVILLAPDMVLERFNDEAEIFVLEQTVKENQTFVAIDRATTKGFKVDFLAGKNERVEEIGFDWITQATFLQVVKAFAEVRGNNFM